MSESMNGLRDAIKALAGHSTADLVGVAPPRIGADSDPGVAR